jgi:pyridoxamine 5'-phosphate oxidase
MTLKRQDLKSTPFEQLSSWLLDAKSADVKEPTAMVLATSTLFGRPSIRAVLLKDMDARGLVFYTHYTSEKSIELDENPFCSALFLWNELGRQVCLEPKAQKVSDHESDNYFATRARESQIARWASHQGDTIASRSVLDTAYATMESHFHGKTVPRPQSWGGWRIIPSRFEFWQGRPYRLHDRFQYILNQGSWVITRLAP